MELSWSQAGPGGRFPVSFTLDPGGADEGEYTLRFSLAMPGMSPVTVSRELRIVEGGGP